MTTNDKLNCYFKNFVKKALMSKPAVAFKSLAIYEESFKAICEITAEVFAKELKNEHGTTISWTAEEADNKKVCSEKCVQALTAHTIDLDQHVTEGYPAGGRGTSYGNYGHTEWNHLCLPWHYRGIRYQYWIGGGHTRAHNPVGIIRASSSAWNQIMGFRPLVMHTYNVHNLPDAMLGVGKVMLSKLRAHLSRNLDFVDKIDRQKVL